MITFVFLTIISNDFNEDAFLAAAIEFPVKDLLPWPKIQLAFGDGDDNFAPHDLTLQVCVGIVFAGTVVSIGAGRRMWGQLLQPYLVIVVKARFIIVDKDR